MAGRARPDALGAVIFHGMWDGLRVLRATATPAASPAPVAPQRAPTATSALDRQLVRLLADMVLATQLEVDHAH